MKRNEYHWNLAVWSSWKRVISDTFPKLLTHWGWPRQWLNYERSSIFKSKNNTHHCNQVCHQVDLCMRMCWWPRYMLHQRLHWRCIQCSVYKILLKEEKNQSVLKAISIHNGRNCFNLFQISIVLNTTVLSGSSKQEAWRIRKTISSKGKLYLNMEGIASICFKSQLCSILQTTDPGVSKDSESCGKSNDTHL